MRDPRAGGDDSFFAQPSGTRPAFNPGNASPFSVPRTENVPRRTGRNPLKTLISWAVFVLVVIVAWKYGYPAVMHQVHAKAITAVTDDLETVAAAEQNYQRLYGTYTSELGNLSTPGTLSTITVVSAGPGSYCLEGRAPTGSIVRYHSSAGGASELPCN